MKHKAPTAKANKPKGPLFIKSRGQHYTQGERNQILKLVKMMDGERGEQTKFLKATGLTYTTLKRIMENPTPKEPKEHAWEKALAQAA